MRSSSSAHGPTGRFGVSVGLARTIATGVDCATLAVRIYGGLVPRPMATSTTKDEEDGKVEAIDYGQDNKNYHQHRHKPVLAHTPTADFLSTPQPCKTKH